MLGELEEEEEEEEGVKFIPDRPGGSVAVFCPLKLFLHTGHVSCWKTHGQKHVTLFFSTFYSLQNLEKHHVSTNILSSIT